MHGSRPIRGHARRQATRPFLSRRGRLQPRKGFWWRFDGFVLDAVTVAIPLTMFAVVIPVQHEKNLHARVEYALTETSDLKREIRWFHLENDHFPPDAQALGTGERHNYPDGGYYRLEDNGVVRIRFSFKPELKSGSILQTPKVTGDRFTWTCAVEGEIEHRYVPSSCRD